MTSLVVAAMVVRPYSMVNKNKMLHLVHQYYWLPKFVHSFFVRIIHTSATRYRSPMVVQLFFVSVVHLIVQIYEINDSLVLDQSPVQNPIHQILIPFRFFPFVTNTIMKIVVVVVLRMIRMMLMHGSFFVQHHRRLWIGH